MTEKGGNRGWGVGDEISGVNQFKSIKSARSIYWPIGIHEKLE